MLALILATTLSMTLPAYRADRDTTGRELCAPSWVPLTDLSRLEIWGAPRWGSMRLIADLDVSGREGQPVLYLFDEGPEPVWTIRVRTRRLGSPKPSCWSNQIGINLGPGIPDPGKDVQP